MSFKEEKDLRNYIVDIIEENIMRESAAIGTAAILARALADKIIDSLPSIGLVYSKSRLPTGRPRAVVFKLMPNNNSATVLSTASKSSEALEHARRDAKGPKYFSRVNSTSYKGYPGDLLIFGTDCYDNYPGIDSNSYGADISSSLNEYKEIGNEFITSYIANISTRKKLVEQFGSAAAIGYFVAKFIVVLPQKESKGSVGHVSGITAREGAGQVLKFRNNTMTVSAEKSNLWSKLDDEFRSAWIDFSIAAPKPGARINAKRNLNFITTGLKAEIARNSTYIHELQHLIQHAVYQTPVSHANPIQSDSSDLLNTSHPLHPYGFWDNSYGSYRGNSLAADIGLAKEKRPSKQHVNIVSSVLRDMGAIGGNEVKLAGINSAAFKVSENWLTGLNLGLAKKQASSRSPAKTLYVVYANSTAEDYPLAWDILGYMSDNYLASMPSAKKDPEERATQIARYNSPKEKKSVTRKYRMFLADLISDLAIQSHQDKFDTSNQGYASLGFGPKDITKPKALKKYASTGDGKKDNESRKKNIEKMEALLKNKGGKLSRKLQETLTNTSFPGIIFYSKTLDLFLPTPRYSGYININIPKEWLVSTGLLSAELTKDILESENANTSIDIVSRFFSELDLYIVVSKSLSQSPEYERDSLRTVGGKEQRVSPGIGNMGVAWYKRANGYTWEKLRGEYDAEFVTHTAGILYTLHMIGTSSTRVTSQEADISFLTQKNRFGVYSQSERLSQLFFAVLEENVLVATRLIKSFSSGKLTSRFRDDIPSEVKDQKSDQYRRLAIDFIETIQGISDEDLNAIEAKAASLTPEFAKKKTKKAKRQIKDIIQKYIDTKDSSNLSRESIKLIENFVMQTLGYIGKKLLE